MQPNLIISTAHSADSLLEAKGHGCPEALLLAWVAWEGLRVRTLCVGLAKMGWQIQDVYDVLSKERAYTTGQYDRLFAHIFGKRPHNSSGIGTTWSAIEAYRVIRHRYVHGMGGAKPSLLEHGTLFITAHVADPEWLARLQVMTTNGRIPIGHPYAVQRGGRERKRPKAELSRLLRELAGGHR